MTSASSVIGDQYRPRADSLAARLCAYFHKNPEESLSEADIVIKFDVLQRNIAHTLQSAVSAGLLKVERREYSMGPKPLVLEEAAALPPSTPARVKAPRGGRMAAFYVDVSTVKIEDNVPIPSARKRGSQVDWESLFQRMATGSSFVVDLAARSSLAKASTAFHKAKSGQIVVRKV